MKTELFIRRVFSLSIKPVKVGAQASMRSGLYADDFNTRKANKETPCEGSSNADDLVEQYKAVIKHMLNIVDKSKTELIASYQKVMNLQGELFGDDK